MSVLTVGAPAEVAGQPASAAPSSRAQLLTVAWFFGLSPVLAVVAVAAAMPAELLPFVLALGPTVIAVALAWREGGGALGRLRRSLTKRPPRRIWYLALAIPVLWAFTTVAIALALGQPTTALFGNLFPTVPIIFLVVLVPALAEEVAWRGFALPRLMSAMSPVAAALVLAVPWALMHVGLQLPGQVNQQLILWPLGLSIAAYSVILAWLYIRTGGSVLMTALFHAGLNAMSPVMVGVEANTQWVIRNVLASVIAVAIVALGGFRGTHLRRRTVDRGAPTPAVSTGGIS